MDREYVITELTRFLQTTLEVILDSTEHVVVEVSGQGPLIVFTIGMEGSSTELPRIIGRYKKTLYAIQRLMHVAARKYKYDCHVQTVPEGQAT